MRAVPRKTTGKSPFCAARARLLRRYLRRVLTPPPNPVETLSDPSPYADFYYLRINSARTGERGALNAHVRSLARYSRRRTGPGSVFTRAHDITYGETVFGTRFLPRFVSGKRTAERGGEITKKRLGEKSAAATYAHGRHC